MHGDFHEGGDMAFGARIRVRGVLQVEAHVKGICPRGNNKVVIILFQVYDKCLFLML